MIWLFQVNPLWQIYKKKKKQPRCNTNSVEMEVSSICEFKFIAYIKS